VKNLERTLLICSVLFSCIGCDQVTKGIAGQTLPKLETISFANDILRLRYCENPGAFLGFGANAPESFRYWTFTLVVFCFLSGLLAYAIFSKASTANKIVALSLIAGGGFGNLIDRICNNGKVIDFMNVGIGPVRTGIFNVADIAILIGVVWLSVISFNGNRTGMALDRHVGPK
jgi:signal peptidase II